MGLLEPLARWFKAPHRCARGEQERGEPQSGSTRPVGIETRGKCGDELGPSSGEGVPPIPRPSQSSPTPPAPTEADEPCRNPGTRLAPSVGLGRHQHTHPRSCRNAGGQRRKAYGREGTSLTLGARLEQVRGRDSGWRPGSGRRATDTVLSAARADSWEPRARGAGTGSGARESWAAAPRGRGRRNRSRSGSREEAGGGRAAAGCRASLLQPPPPAGGPRPIRGARGCGARARDRGRAGPGS